ncbi:MAG: cobalamin biosynthesis protein [Nitrososphaeraceae archaeon]
MKWLSGHSNKEIAVLTITRHGLEIARVIKQNLRDVQIYSPSKFNDSDNEIIWFTEQTSKVIQNLFKNSRALICIFSLGAVIRLISPYIGDKKSDPAVLVIDDKANFVISALSGHLGGANSMAEQVASYFPNAKPVITTAADVNETIAVDLVGKEFGWEIENYENITKVSALMVNEEKMAVYQDTGQSGWYKNKLPGNVSAVASLEDLKTADFKGGLIISEKHIKDPDILGKSVIYRPKSLVVGVGLHWDTSKDTISKGIETLMQKNDLSFNSIRNISSLRREKEVSGLQEFSSEFKIPIQMFNKEELASIPVPNPSKIVNKFEGTSSVAESSAILSSRGVLIIPKQKFPPNLTVAVARVKFD